MSALKMDVDSCMWLASRAADSLQGDWQTSVTMTLLPLQ